MAQWRPLSPFGKILVVIGSILLVPVVVVFGPVWMIITSIIYVCDFLDAV